MSVTDLSDSAQNHLKTIWSLTEWSDQPVTAAALAEALGLRRSTVSDALKRLREQGLVEHAPYGTVTLTELGREHAVAMVRRHRLIETFLVETLGYTWDQVHDEAEVLEHSVSEFMVERMASVLGDPERDPHGDPIPRADGTVAVPDAAPLAARDARPGEVVVQRISDADPQLLQELAGQGVRVGAHLRIEGHREEALRGVVVDLGEEVSLSPAAAAALYVSEAPEPALRAAAQG